MKVTIRGVDQAKWEAARIATVQENITIGQLVNEALALRAAAKAAEAKVR